MDEQIFPRKRFDEIYASLKIKQKLDVDFLYSCFLDCVKACQELGKKNPAFSEHLVNPAILLLYLVNEHIFFLMVNPEKKEADLIKETDYVGLLLSVTVDKYFTNEHLSFQNISLTNRFLPEISTLLVYLNFINGMLRRYRKGEPDKTLMVDVMSKGFSMSICITNLLTGGYETEAFSTWRTLHENECILILIAKYGKPLIDRYIRHLQYAVAFRGGVMNKEETDKTFVEIKEGMKSIGLKSKDMKRYIEYGWLLGIPNVMETPDFKFNFRDGVERCAGLRAYSKVYEWSSEIAHSSPLLIYSTKGYYYHMTLINLYESFFRLEKIFGTLYLSNVPETEQNRYLAMRKLYFSELQAAYKLLKSRFAISQKKEEPVTGEENANSEE